MPKLEIRSGKAAGQVVELTSSTITLGNRRNATIELKDPWVSFNHAKITREGEQFFLADMRSKAGTFLNQKRVDAPVPLNGGDKILLGKTEMLFTADAPVTTPSMLASASASASSAPGAATFAAMAPAPVELLERIASLERDLGLAQKDTKALREAHVAREKLLADTNAKLRAAESRATSAEKAADAARAQAEAARAQAAAEALSARALPPPPPLMPAATPSSRDAVAGQEVARWRTAYEEVRARYDDVVAKGKARIEDLTHRLEAAQKAHAAGSSTAQAAVAPAASAGLADAERAALTKRFESELKAYETALEERNKDVERLEAALEKAATELADRADRAPSSDSSESTTPGAIPSAASSTPATSNDTESVKIREDLTEKTKRIEELSRINADLRSQLEEINQDMLAQEEELRGEIAQLERKLQEATQPGRSPG